MGTATAQRQNGTLETRHYLHVICKLNDDDVDVVVVDDDDDDDDVSETACSHTV